VARKFGKDSLVKWASEIFGEEKFDEDTNPQAAVLFNRFVEMC